MLSTNSYLWTKNIHKNVRSILAAFKFSYKQYVKIISVSILDVPEVAGVLKELVILQLLQTP